MDTTALEKEDAIRLEIVGENTSIGKWVQITDLSEKDYYKIEYQIDSTEGEWSPIESGKTVEVPYSSTINARLVFGSNKGIIVSLSIEASNPESDGTGTVEFSVSGNLNYKNQSFNSTQINNLSALEIGTYTIICKVTSPTNKTAVATKNNVKVTRLANTTTSNASNSNVSANAIYNKYDLHYFRDLVNGGQTTLKCNFKYSNEYDKFSRRNYRRY